MASTDRVDVNGSPMDICIAMPPGDGPFKGVVVMCHITGLDAFTHRVVDDLAQAGYAAAAPDVFHYHDWVEDREERRATLSDTRILDDIRATMTHLESSTTVDSGPMAIMGHCMGGRTALLGAGNIKRFGPLAMFYGGRTMQSWGGDGPTPFERIAHVCGPVIGFFGLDDSEPSPADVDKIEARFAHNGIDCSFHRYAGAGHAFQNFSSPERYRPEASADAQAKLIAFLAKAF